MMFLFSVCGVGAGATQANSSGHGRANGESGAVGPSLRVLLCLGRHQLLVEVRLRIDTELFQLGELGIPRLLLRDIFVELGLRRDAQLLQLTQLGIALLLLGRLLVELGLRLDTQLLQLSIFGLEPCDLRLEL
jgi:hypothetical protein